LKEVWKQTAFKQGEFEIMKQFGETLGRHDRFSQQKHIMLTLSHLEREEADAVENQAKYEKMVKSLGFFSGLLLIILLI
jgi:stage III sporulation protein AB